MNNEVKFNPKEHVPVPAVENALPVSEKSEGQKLETEGFVSLKAIADKEKAEIIALALNQEVNRKLEDVEVARALLSEAKTKEEKVEAQKMIEEIKREITSLIDIYSRSSQGTAPTIVNMLARGRARSIWHKALHGDTIGRRNDGLIQDKGISLQEKKLVEQYDKYAFGLIKEAQHDQQAVLEFLVKNNFQVPMLEKRGVPGEGEKAFSMARFLEVALRQMETPFRMFMREGRYSSMGHDIKSYHEFIQKVKERFAELDVLPQPDLEKFLKFVIAYNMHFEPQKYLGGARGPRLDSPDHGSDGSSDGSYSPVTVNIRYNADKIKALKDDADMLIIPDIPNETIIMNIPFSSGGFKPGANFENALNLSNAFADDLDKYPQISNPHILRHIEESFKELYLGVYLSERMSKEKERESVSLSNKFLC